MKVMIVEDEILVRLGLRKSIPWSGLGLELAGEAADGAEAFELFERHLPDIVLVDIEMPKMDGLQFIRHAKSLRPDARFIVLTCHQDMKYAREAIHLQVSDFLLKSTLDMDELRDILHHISLDIARERREAERAKSLGAALELPMDALMRNWLDGAYGESGEILRRLGELGIATVAGPYWACVLQPFGHPPAHGASDHIGRLWQERFGPQLIGGVEDLPAFRWHFVLSGYPERAEIAEWQRLAEEKTGFAVSVAIGSPFGETREWPARDREAAHLLQLQYYEDAAGIYEAGDAVREMLSETALKLKKEIYESIESLQFAAAKRKIAELRAEWSRTPRLHPSIVKNLATEFLFRAWSACEELAMGMQADHRLVDRIYESSRIAQTVSLLTEELERFESHLSLTHTPEDKSKIVILIKQYIKTHLQKEISLQEIAATFYMNSNYLSRLFKEVSSKSFTEFVLYEKTELAVMMMKNGKSLTEISEKLGYLNLSSFTRMFKKVRGVSPSRFFHVKSKDEIG